MPLIPRITGFRWERPFGVSFGVALAILMLLKSSAALGQVGQPDTVAPVRNLTLDEAIDLALEHNRTIAIAGKNTQHYQELRAQARADYFPKIKNHSEVSHLTDREGIVIPAGSFGLPAGGDPIPAKAVKIDQGAKSTYFSMTELTQPLTQLLSVHQADRAAKADVKVAQSQEMSTRIEVVAAVHKVYYGVLLSEDQQRAAEVNRTAAREAAHEVRANNEQESALLEDVLQSQANFAEADKDVRQAALQTRDTLLSLNDLLGLPPQTVLTLQIPSPPEASFEGLPTREAAVREALEHDPKVHMAEQEVAKAEAGVKIADYSYIPDVTALAHESYQSGIAFFDHNYGVFEGQVSINLFDGGKRRAKVRDAKSSLAKAQLTLDEQREERRRGYTERYLDAAVEILKRD